MTDAKTLFHRIIDREIPSKVEYEDTDVLVIHDIHPKAPTHLLFLPKIFVPSIIELTEETRHLPGMLILKARNFAVENEIEGYKLMFHVGKAGGQEVFYLHLHFMAEKKLPKK